MSLQDRLSSQNLVQLLTTAVTISIVPATSTSGSKYNFPLFLFGIIAHEIHGSTHPFRQFLILILFTAIPDLFSLLTHSLSFLVSLCTILIILLKIPIFFTGLAQLRERGGDLRWGQGQGTFGFQGMQGNSWGVPTTFSAQPSSGGQQTTGSGTAPAPPGSSPSSGGFRLGSEDEESGNVPPPPPLSGRGGYQTIA